MESRVNFKIVPDAYEAMLGLEEYLHKSSIEQPLLHLIKMRASQINGCAYCIDMHSKDLRAIGEPEHRLYALDAWRESPWYTPREQAALAWTEAVTNIAQTHANDAEYENVRTQFNEREFADLTFAIATINTWNRLAISFRVPPGHYRSSLKPIIPASGSPQPDARG